MSNLNNFLQSFEKKDEEKPFNNKEVTKAPLKSKKAKLNLKKKEVVEEAVMVPPEEIPDPETKSNNIDINKLFIQSETPEIFKEKWMDLYQKALSSDKKTMTNQKIRNGRFRFDSKGLLEILPNFETYGKNSNQLLHETWNIK